MKRILFIISIILSLGFSCFAQKIEFIGAPEIAFPNVVTTDKTEIKLAFSPDGRRMLWGTIGWQTGVEAWNIFESVNENGKWSEPQPVSFNSTANDFDPFFAPDGKGVYFFSNRADGFGGDDIYFVPFDKRTKTYGKAENLGANINSKGDEWGAITSHDGKTLLYCTDGRGGAGKHDLFTAKKTAKGWSEAASLGKINSPLDDFDPVFLDNGKAIVFASERQGADNVDLYITYLVKGAYTEPENLGTAVNSSENWVFGASTNPREKDVLYFNSRIEGKTLGQTDIYKIKYRIVKK